MWVNIQETLYNLDKYRKIEGDEMPNGKTYLSMIDDSGNEVRIKMTAEEILNTLDTIAKLYYDNWVDHEPDISFNPPKGFKQKKGVDNDKDMEE